MGKAPCGNLRDETWKALSAWSSGPEAEWSHWDSTFLSGLEVQGQIFHIPDIEVI